MGQAIGPGWRLLRCPSLAPDHPFHHRLPRCHLLWHCRRSRKGFDWVSSASYQLWFSTVLTSVFREPFWSRGHSELFRICESPSTTSSTVAVHTCNVYRPRQDLSAPPIHAFTENIRSWLRGGTYLSGSATRVRAVTLESMLLERGLRCTPSSTNGQSRPSGRAQIIIGGVGQSYGYRRRAKACNFDENGRNIQGHCGEYGDGGVRAVAKSHPLSINQIFQKHFGMTCTWV
jgi:hypothetical protein